MNRELGPQPIGSIMADHDLSVHDLVAASTEQITHKMVTRGVKGRRLTSNSQNKLRNALQVATHKPFTLDELFTYKAVTTRSANIAQQTQRFGRLEK